MPRPPQLDEDRYEALKQSVADIGLVRSGSLVRRFMPCGKAHCRCQASPPKLHGPYFQWTRKIRGRTVTVRVAEHEAHLFADWIANRRRLHHIVGQIEQVSLRLTDRLLRTPQPSSQTTSTAHHAPGRKP